MKKFFLMLMLMTMAAFAATPVFACHIPQDATMDYCNPVGFKIVKVEDVVDIEWLKITTFINQDAMVNKKTGNVDNLKEKIHLFIDQRNYRLVAIWHLKKEAEVSTVGCYADSDYILTFGKSNPRWITFQSDFRKELDNFLYLLSKLLKESAKTNKFASMIVEDTS